MSPRIRRQLKPLITIVLLGILAAYVGGTILSHQRVRFPLVERVPLRIGAEFRTAQAVTPGQGQTVQVSGVRVGDIADVDLKDGRAIVWMDIKPEYKDLIHTDATALLRPRTGLKDMFIDVQPGSLTAPVARADWVMSVGQTDPDVNLDEITQMLDTDTREHLQQLVGAGAQGLRGHGDELKEVLRRFEPTHRDLARVAGRLAKRRVALRRLVTSLRDITGELAGREDDLTRMVSASARALGAVADEQHALSDGVRELPPALTQTRRALDELRAFGAELGPASDALRPVVAKLPRAATALTAIARESTPVLRKDVRPFTREARPLVRDLRAPTVQLRDAAPWAIRAGTRLERLGNMLGYNRDGREGPDDADRDEGFMFWVAWTTHVGKEIFATGDANGPLRPLAQQGSCSSFAAFAEGLGVGDPLLGTVLGGLQGVFSDPRVCGPEAGPTTKLGKRLRGGKLRRSGTSPAWLKAHGRSIR